MLERVRDHGTPKVGRGILPPMIYIDASDEPRATWMQGIFELMAAEARQFRPGGEAVITRLADVLVIQAIRAGSTPHRPRAPAGSAPFKTSRSAGR